MKLHRLLRLLLAFLIVSRIVTLIWSPLTDQSESRYAEMARKMVETGNWVTPQFDYGTPFWGKPPLSMWLSAAGLELFGNHEFGARIFIFLAAMVVLWLVAAAVRREMDATRGLAAAAVLMAMPLFYYCSAAVMTDMALILGTTLTMVCFRRATRGDGRGWGYGIFAGLAIGLLAKGPLTLVLALPPLAGWALLTGNLRRTWQQVPWISGSLLMLALALPWYVAAERATPGFLDYFLVGEHWKRFTETGWQGDLYGNAHSETPGTIWLYALTLTFPWCLGFFAAPIRRWRGAFENDGRVLYHLLWAVWPLAFFTPARNIISTYPLPALPALAMLLAEFMKSPAAEKLEGPGFRLFHPAMVAGSLVTVFAYGFSTILAADRVPKKSEKALVSVFEDYFEDGDHLLYYGTRRYSAEFYSAGQAENVQSPAELMARVESPGRLYLAVRNRDFMHLPDAVRRRFTPLTARGGKLANLYQEREFPQLMTASSPIGN